MTPASRTVVIASTLAAATACAWALRPHPADTLRVAVHEGKVRLETPKGEVEIPAGRVARATGGAAPLLLAEVAADEKEREGFLKGAEAGEPDFLKPAEEPAWKQVLRERLRQQVHYKFPDIPFKDAKDYLEIRGRVVINVDKLAQESNNGTLNETSINLSSPEEGMSLESALNYLTAAVGLTWTLRDETIVITTPAGLREPSQLQAYDVKSLLGDARDFKAAEADLVDFIKGSVDKPVWDLPDTSVHMANGMLLATAPPVTHRKIREVLAGLWKGLNTPASTLPEEPAEPAWKQVLQERLGQKVRFRFEGISFQDAKDDLEVQGKVVINMDKLALDANPSLLETPIQLTSPEAGMSLESALNYLTQAVGLAWILRDESLVVTTSDRLREPPELRAYDVKNLLIAHRKDIAKQTEKILSLLKETVDKPLWNSPDCSIQYFMGSLFVCAPPDTQKKVRSLLREMGARDAPKR